VASRSGDITVGRPDLRIYPVIVDRIGVVLRQGITWLSVVGGVVSLAVLFIPKLNELAGEHGVLGWFVGIVALTAFLAVGEHAHKLRRQNRELQAQAANEVAEREAAARQRRVTKDLELVDERLDGWTVTQGFFRYLVEDADHSRFPRRYSRDLDERARKWDVDDRRIADPDLASAWTRVETAVTAYSRALEEHTWTMDSRGQPGKPTYVQVPREWEGRDPQRFYAAHDALEAHREELITALRDLFAERHDLQ